MACAPPGPEGERRESRFLRFLPARTAGIMRSSLSLNRLLSIKFMVRPGDIKPLLEMLTRFNSLEDEATIDVGDWI